MIYPIDLKFSGKMHVQKKNIRLKSGCKRPSMTKVIAFNSKTYWIESSAFSNNLSDAMGAESGCSIQKLIIRKVLDALDF